MEAPSNRSASAATVVYDGNGIWHLVPEGSPVHLVALFRDPGIEDNREVQTVLDLHEVDGRLRAGKSCWLDRMVEALYDLPVGISLALHNGVDIPCPKPDGMSRYARLLKEQLPERLAWIRRRRRPDNAQAGVLVCDRDLARALSGLGKLQTNTGAWTEPRRFVEAVGTEIIFDGIRGMILAHPAVLRWRPDTYIPAVTGAIPKMLRLAGLNPAEGTPIGEAARIKGQSSL